MKFFSAKSNNSAILITLLIVVALGSVYFFIYLPYNEKIIQEQRFRALQNVSRNVEAKIGNSATLLNNLLDFYFDPTEKRSKDYIDKSKENFVLTDIIKIPVAEWRKDSLRDTYKIDVHKSTKRIDLVLYKEYVKGRDAIYSKDINGPDTLILRGAIQFSFKQFVSTLLQKNVFDEYVIFSNNKPVYETFPSGIEEIKKDSLLGSYKGMAAAGMREFSISGNNYKVFLQPVSVSSNEAWTIGGLLTSSRYEKERKQLPANMVLLLVTVVLGMVLLFPWIRIFHAGNKERFTLVDGISSIVVSMLLMSLLFLTMFKYSFSSNSKKNKPGPGNVLAQKISTAFNKEIDTIYETAYRYSDFKDKKNIESDIVFLKNEPAFYNLKDFSSVKLDDSLAQSLLAIGKNVSVKQLVWQNKKGQETLRWTTTGLIPPRVDYSEREYFKHIKAADFYFINDDTAKKYFLDQVISWTTGEFTTIMAIPSENGVVALSFKMRSLENILLPVGYQFAVIDANGKVLYHSDSSRNLNENLLSEFSGKGKKDFAGNLQSHTASDFTVDYFSNKYNVHLQPLAKLPYSIVIFEDIGYQEARDTEIYSFTFCMLFLFFAFLLFKLFVIFLSSARQPFFKRQFYDTYWIGPKVSGHYEYILTAFFNIIVILLLILFFFFSSILTYLFILVVSACFSSLFINGLFLSRYNSQKRINNIKYKQNAIIVLAVLLVVVNLFAFTVLNGDHGLLLIGYQLIVMVIGSLIIWSHANIPDKYTFHKNFATGFFRKLCAVQIPKWNYANSFSVMIFSRLFLTSGIPIMFFYIISYNYCQTIDVRYRHAKYGEGLAKKYSDAGDSSIQKFTDTLGVYADGSFIADVKKTKKSEVHSAYKLTREDRVTFSLLRLFRIGINEEANKVNSFYKDVSGDLQTVHNPLPDKIYPKNEVETYRQAKLPGYYFKISSSNLNYEFENPQYPLVSWAGILVVLLMFFFILFYVVKKLFALKIPDLPVWKSLDEKILEDNELNSLIFLIGLPGSGKTKEITDKIKASKIRSKTGKQEISPVITSNDYTIVDLFRIPDTDNNEEMSEWKKYADGVLHKNYKLVVINNFEYNIQNPHTNRVKLNFLESLLMQRDKCKIFILSTIHPVAFLDSAFTQSRKKNDKEKSPLVDGKSVPGEDLERWHVLLGHYRIVLLPIEKVTATTDFSNDEPLTKLINNETKRTVFLNKFRVPAQEAAKEVEAQLGKDDDLYPDEMGFKLQNTAHYFYMYIWQSLTKEEKFLLYDLAEDNLVNSFDGYNLSMLVAKGIIVKRDGALTIFNKGFRNFILTAIGNSEVMKIKDEIRDSGNWSKLRAPLLILIIAILIFLLASQQEAYSTLLSYIAALGAAIPAILRIFSFFGKEGEKSAN